MADLQEASSSPGLSQRSPSLITIPTAAIQPRMAQLETLEAKMASIEVSLSNTPRRKKNGSVTGSVTSSIRSTSNKDLAAKELENLRNALKDKENIIQNLKGQLTMNGLKLSNQIIRNGNYVNGNVTNGINGSNAQQESKDFDRKMMEERLGRLRNETDNKRLMIKKLKMALERLDITDNIDVRIQQAELEYQVGREELNLLTLLEEVRGLQICLEESNKKAFSIEHTFYSLIDETKSATLFGIDLSYDPKAPNFGAGPKENNGQGLWIDWTLENTGLRKGDRLVEVNGKVVLTKTREDMVRLLAADPNPAKIVVLRKRNSDNGKIKEVEAGAAIKQISSLRSELEMVRERAEEAQRAKDGLRSDNIRLTHRISYLEEQVSELLNKKPPPATLSSTVKSHHNVTNINITSHPTPTTNPELLFQKGPQVTTLIQNFHESKIPQNQFQMRSKSSLSNVSGEQKSRYNNTNNNILMEQSYKKATKIVQDLTKDKHKPTCFEPPQNTDILKHYNARKSTSIVDLQSQIRISHKSNSKSSEALENITSKRFYRKNDVRSVKSLDFDSDCSSANARNGIYEKPRPMPPKKPIRLSLHRAQSSQSVERDHGEALQVRKPTKRNYKSEILAANSNEIIWASNKYGPHKIDGCIGIENASWC